MSPPPMWRPFVVVLPSLFPPSLRLHPCSAVPSSIPRSASPNPPPPQPPSYIPHLLCGPHRTVFHLPASFNAIICLCVACVSLSHSSLSISPRMNSWIRNFPPPLPNSPLLLLLDALSLSVPSLVDEDEDITPGKDGESELGVSDRSCHGLFPPEHERYLCLRIRQIRRCFQLGVVILVASN